MLKQLLSSDFANDALANISALLGYLNINISELNKVKLVALALIISALTIFVFLIIIIIIRNIVNFFKQEKAHSAPSSDSSQNAIDEALFSEEEQQELELELQKELDLALAQRAELEHKKEQEQLSVYRHEKETTENEKEQKKSSYDKKNEIEKSEQAVALKTKKSLTIDLDWQKQKTPPATEIKEVDTSMLSYQQKAVELNQLIGLLIDMIGRGVDELKIAQTLNYKTQSLNSENDILKLIDAVKCFISLCQSGKFTALENYSELPDVNLALYHLANNDVSIALVLLENLMDKNIDKTASAAEAKRQQIFAEVSNYACCLGALAETNDIMLATSVYEMAIELNSSNAAAWSRLGDVYSQTNSESKAIWAYQNAYSFADSEINAAELANASQHMSDYLYAQGNTLQAAKMHNIAKQYYDSLGITNRVSKQEIEAISIIESNHQQNLPEIIETILQRSL